MVKILSSGFFLNRIRLHKNKGIDDGRHNFEDEGYYPLSKQRIYLSGGNVTEKLFIFAQNKFKVNQ